MSKTIAMIGIGHLATALFRGWMKQKVMPATSFLLTNPSHGKVIQLVETWGARAVDSNQDAAEGADTIMIAVRPRVVASVCQDIQPVLKRKVEANKNPLIVSLASVASTESISAWLGMKNISILRAMTNTSTEFAQGSTALFANEAVTFEQKRWAESLFRTVGGVVWVEDERYFDRYTAPIGCAPAYVFLLIEAIQKAAIESGIPKDFAAKIALEVVRGAAESATQSTLSAEQLRLNVATPHGVTERSLQAISPDAFFESFRRGFQAAEQRIDEMDVEVNVPPAGKGL